MYPLPPASLFRAYDIRGIVEQGLDAEAMLAIGHALGSEARERELDSIVIGRDGRLTSAMLQEALAAGLSRAGMAVWDAGQVPTPLLYYAALTHAGGCGAMVTGSHNPPAYNGLKMMLGGKTLSSESVQGIRRRLAEGRLSSGEGVRRSLSLEDAYLEELGSKIRLSVPLKVAVDCGSGTASLVAPRLLESLGCEVTAICCEVDGHFPHHHPDPSQPENLADLQAAVLEAEADIGLAFDGDGDRLGVVGPDGSIIWPDRLLMLFARELLARRPGAEVVFDVKCSGQLKRVVREAGGVPVMCRTGHSLLKAELESRDAPLGGEMSGHLFLREDWYGYDDAFYAAARLLEILSADGRPVAEQFAGLPDSPSTPELRVEMAEGENFAFMRRLLSRGDGWDGGEVNTLDGLRVDYTDGWGLVRASNTTPTLTLRFQGDDEAALRRIKACFRRHLLALEPSLRLPF